MLYWLIVAAVALCCLSHAEAKEPWDDAEAVWHFQNAKNASGAGGELSVSGAAKLGVKMDAEGQRRSQACGGDGYYAEARSGGFFAAHAGDGKLDLSGRQLTLVARVAILDESVSASVVSIHTGDRLPLNLFLSPGNNRPVLGAVIATTGNNDSLKVSVPVAELRERRWHEIACRLDGAKLELFVDGRCVDEDFLLGDLKIGRGPTLIGVVGAGGASKSGAPVALLDHVALWRRGLSNDEIAALSGGEKFADARERTDRGLASESLQYWSPPNDYNVGDCFPFYHDGRFHFLYLIDKHHHRAKNGLGAHQWAQATSRDLVHWQHQPLAVPISAQWEGSICTGSFFWHDGLYYAFYATRSAGDDKRGLPMWHQYMAYATSRDGIHFEKQEPNPLFSIPEKFGPADFRDPVVFHDPTTGLFHMLITSTLRTGGGCLVHMTSQDLKKWDEAEPIITGGNGHPECPSHFEWNGKYYLTYCFGNGHYYVSDKPAGPWKKPEQDVFCYGANYVPKVAPYKDNRRLVCAWIPRGGWGGVSVWRELVALPNNRLGSKWPAELIPKTGEALKLPAPKLAADRSHEVADLPSDYRLTLELDSTKAIEPWGVRLRDDDTKSLELRVLPQEKRIELGPHNMPWTGDISKLDIIVKGFVVDVCVDDRETLVSDRAGDLQGTRAAVFGDPAQVAIKSLTIRPLAATAE